MSKSAFIDEAVIAVAGGDGGAGIVSFLRERARPFGGPNGGNGGRGGDVILRADAAANTLSEFRYRRHIRAGNGRRGEGGNRHGAAGADADIVAPLGTIVTDAVSGFLHADLAEAGAETILARGGRGGLGNAHFRSSVNRAPRTCTEGEAGEAREFKLELRVLADVGLLGLPNAGKSAFLRAVSAARPKVAAYPFTTLAPQLGWVELERGGEALIVADIPGIIRGAAAGAGLGSRFLRHLSRAALLCQVIDAAAPELLADCRAVHEELQNAADEELAKKPRWLLLNKIDLLSAAERAEALARLREACPYFERVMALSALTGEGVRDCVSALLERRAAQAEAVAQAAQAAQGQATA